MIVEAGLEGTSVESGRWFRATAATHHHGATSWYTTVGGTIDRYRFTPQVPEDGLYEVAAWNSCYSPRATAVPHDIGHLGGVTTVFVNQDCHSGVHGQWQVLGQFELGSGTEAYVDISDRNLSSGSYIGADALRFVKIGEVDDGGLETSTPTTDSTTTTTNSDADAETATDSSEDSGDATDTTGTTDESSTSTEGEESGDPVQVDIIMDAGSTGTSVISGQWYRATAATYHYGPRSEYARVGGNIDRYRFHPQLPVAGTYRISAWNSCYSPRSQAVPHEIIEDGQLRARVEVDQDCGTGSYGEWLSLGEFALAGGDRTWVDVSDQGVSDGQYLGADAIRFELVGDPGPDDQAPMITVLAPGPSLPASTEGVAIVIRTDEQATCRYDDQGGRPFDLMTGELASQDGLEHSVWLAGLQPDTHYQYALRCRDLVGNEHGEDHDLVFHVRAEIDPDATWRDDFDGPELDPSWQSVNSGNFEQHLNNGELHMQLDESCGAWPTCVWFHAADDGAFLHRPTQGNFKLTAAIAPRRVSAPNLAPETGSNIYLFAGLMARAPSSDTGPEDYVFTVSGARGPHGLVNEIKNTVEDDSVSIHSYGYPEPDTADAELRLCRVGQRFHLLVREQGQWVARPQVFDRSQSPMPDELQVGLITYNFGTNYDILGRFDFVEYAPVDQVADCYTD